MDEDLSPADLVLREEAPALWAALSPLGRRVRQPPAFLPLQGAEARTAELNASIGQITDGKGRALPLPALAAALPGLPPAALSQALLYSPVEGLPELRRRWRERQLAARRSALQGAEPDSSLPLVTLGSAQGLALLAELFVVPGRTVVVAAPARAAERELFEVRHAARLVAVDEKCGPTSIAGTLAALPGGEPALIVLGRAAAAALNPLLLAARRRPLVVVVDTGSEPAAADCFWQLSGAHPSLFPFLLESAGPLGFAGGCAGFLTLPFAAGSAPASALESKLKMLLRAAAGSPSTLSQTLLLHAHPAFAAAPAPCPPAGAGASPAASDRPPAQVVGGAGEP